MFCNLLCHFPSMLVNSVFFSPTKYFCHFIQFWLFSIISLASLSSWQSSLSCEKQNRICVIILMVDVFTANNWWRQWKPLAVWLEAVHTLSVVQKTWVQIPVVKLARCDTKYSTEVSRDKTNPQLPNPPLTSLHCGILFYQFLSWPVHGRSKCGFYHSQRRLWQADPLNRNQWFQIQPLTTGTPLLYSFKCFSGLGWESIKFLNWSNTYFIRY